MPKQKRKFFHERRIMDEYLIPVVKLRAGTVLRFFYGDDKAFDNRPLILFLYKNVERELLHGLNLNYLYEKDVQQIFRWISEVVPLIHGEINGQVYSYFDIEDNPNVFTGVQSERIYETVINKINIRLFTCV